MDFRTTAATGGLIAFHRSPCSEFFSGVPFAGR
jgi:hypothetical protein